MMRSMDAFHLCSMYVWAEMEMVDLVLTSSRWFFCAVVVLELQHSLLNLRSYPSLHLTSFLFLLFLSFRAHSQNEDHA